MESPVSHRRRFQEDIIKRMPENVITNILDRLPIQEAVRTSILGRNWRFTWTLLTKLVFDKNFFKYLLSKKHIHLFYKRNLAKVLLQLKGSITKFVLYIPAEKRKRKKEYNAMYEGIVEDINHWILFLSTKGIKDFTLLNMCGTPLKVSDHLFSCLELKYLKLRCCCLRLLPEFRCFPKLLGFDFDHVTVDGCIYGELIARCPLLENLKIKNNPRFGEVQLGEIAKLLNLKSLSLWLCMLGDAVVTSSSIFQLISSLPRLESLDLFFGGKFLAKADGSMRYSANLHRLKRLALNCINFKNHIMAECAFDLINGLPNLQTLKITKATFEVRAPRVPPNVSKVACSIKGNLQLQYVEFEGLRGSEIELDFIESFLVYSPLLKKIVIEETCDGQRNNNCCTLARKLLKLHRASPVAEIHLC